MDKDRKVAWDWWNDWNLKGVPFKAGINMDTYKYYIDFASRNDIEFIVLDEGWYNPKSGDMLTVIPELDLPELIAYGNRKELISFFGQYSMYSTNNWKPPARSTPKWVSKASK